MDTIDKLLFARNELENRINELQRILELPEDGMMLVVEMLLSTARYKTIVRNSYSKLPIEKKVDDETMEELKKREVSNNGN